MEMTVGELKSILNPYSDNSPVKFQHVILPDGKHYRLHLYRIDDRGVSDNRGIGDGSICHFEWNTISEEDEIKF